MRFLIKQPARNLAIAGFTVALLIGAADPDAGTQDDASYPRVIDDQDSPLHNLIQVSPRLYSGSEPVGSEAFAKLKEMGIKTVVSVDGAIPDVATAKEFGLQYVHIPFGYDGIGRDDAASLTRVMRDVEGSIYVHCHHGKHRGPAGAAICAIADRSLDPAGGEQLLKLAQTSPDYAGLYSDVARFQAPSPDDELPELVEVAEIEPMVAVMARVGRLSDELKARQKDQWKPDPAKPDDAPHQTALLLAEELREAGRNLSTGHGDDFVAMMKECEDAAMSLSESLKRNDFKDAGVQFNAAQAACTRCHQEFRN